MGQKVPRRSGINARSLASLALFCAGVWLIPSGIALHFASHEGQTGWSHLFMTMHNTGSVLFVAAAAAHLILNWKVMTRYLSARAGEYLQFKRELLIAVVGVSGLVLLAASHALHVPLDIGYPSTVR
jgi:hypothetical protein